MPRDGHRDDVSYAFLGPFEVRVSGRPAGVGGLRQRSVLALLLVNSGHAVPLDRLVDEVWDGHPPAAAEDTVRVYVSRLRKALAPSAPGTAPLVTRPSGYQLDADPHAVDAEEFERVTADGRRAGESGDHRSGARLLTAALAKWRGPALIDFPQSWARAHALRLEEVRQVAIEARVEADLALGRHAELVGELTLLVAEHPLRERFHAQRMLALYRCGRQAEALDAYRFAYRCLSARRGIDPGRDLRDLEAAILRQDRRLDWVAPARPGDDLRRPAAAVPAQLPADVAGFTGRRGELAALERLTPDRSATALAVVAVTGPAGVGKTALAVHWAHHVAADFPDGQLYVDLRGYGPGQPVSPSQVLAQFLRALGVAPDRVPAVQDEAAVMYRSLLAGGRVLVLLDNAASAEQVRPLLPGSPGCLVLVTSRDRLPGLVARDGVRPLTIGVLDPAEAVALLGEIVGTDRVRAEPAAAAALADACGYLPLALRVAAANVVSGPMRTISSQVADLDAGDRLAALRVDGDDESTVAVAFAQSYSRLPTESRRVFRLLGLVPGADFTVAAAAVLAGTTPARTGPALDRLTGAHLVEQRGADRYALHDLLRLFVRSRAEMEDGPDDRAAAGDRLYGWYLRHVDAAARMLYPQVLRLTPETGRSDVGFPDRAAALAWLDGERHNLVSAVVHTARHGPWATAWTLADALRGYLWVRRHTADWLTVAQAGLAAAKRAGEPRAEAAAELSLGLAYRSLTDNATAAEHYERAAVLSAQAGWAPGRASSANNLGCLYLRTGKLARAEEYLRSALEVNRRAGEALDSAAPNLSNLGYLYLRLGRLGAAADHFREALALPRQLDDGYWTADALQGLGEYHHGVGEFTAALEHLGAALAILQDVGALDAEALCRCAVAAVHCDAGRPVDATAQARTALALVNRTGDRHTEAVARNQLGVVLRRLGRHAEAVDEHTRALQLARSTGSRHPEVEALVGLAAAFAGQGRHDEARGLARQAAAVAREVGFRLLLVHALATLADSELRAGAPARAAGPAREAAEIATEIGTPVGERLRTVLAAVPA